MAKECPAHPSLVDVRWLEHQEQSLHACRDWARRIVTLIRRRDPAAESALWQLSDTLEQLRRELQRVRERGCPGPPLDRPEG